MVHNTPTMTYFWLHYLRMRNRDLDVQTEEIEGIHADQIGSLVRERSLNRIFACASESPL